MARSYNYIYSNLVEDNNDIVGHIAYALYKADKIHFIENFKKENSGNEPDEKDLKPFHDTTSCPGNLERYKLTAIHILQNFTNDTLHEMIQEIEQDAINRNKVELSKIIEPLKPLSIKKSYFHGTVQSVIGAFVFMIIIAGLLFLVSLSTRKYTFTIGGNGNASFEQYSTHSSDTINSER